MLTRGMLRRRLRTRDLTLLDRVYEHLTLPPLVVAAVDTVAFQRLRGLHQLGVSSFLYPGAVHTRFEHSIGVAHMARQLLLNFQKQQPDLGLCDEDVHMVMLAGLLHDVGHGPFSHLFEDVLARRCGVEFDHEDMSARIARRILGELLPQSQVEAVVRLMRGQAASSVPYGEIISNKRNGIDVDKMDYFIRDSICCFGKPTVDVRVNRLFHSARLVCDGGQWQMAFEQKLALSLREFFALRAKLHKNVYQHQVTKALGHMVGDILQLAVPHFRLGGATLTQCACDEELFLRLGDWVLEAIEADTSNAALAPAQALLRRLRCRDIYHTVFASALRPAAATAAALATTTQCSSSGNDDHEKKRNTTSATDAAVDWHAAILAHAHPSLPLQPDDYIVDVVVINQGKGADDPLTSVLFFNPKRPSQPPMRLCNGKDDDNSNNNSDDSGRRCNTGGCCLFTPLLFEERTLMVFERRDTNGAVARACERLTRDSAFADYFVRTVPFYNPK